MFSVLRKKLYKDAYGRYTKTYMVRQSRKLPVVNALLLGGVLFFGALFLPSASALEPAQSTTPDVTQPSIDPGGSVLGANIGPNNAYTSIVLNGGSVSMTGSQSGEKSCETDSPGVCYSFAWLKGETVTVTVVPPAGSRLTSWGSSLCSPQQLTCALSLVDTDGYTLTLQFEPVSTTPEAPLPPSANTVTPSPSVVVASNQLEAPGTITTVQQTQATGQAQVTDIAFNNIPYNNSSKPSVEDGQPVVVSGTTVPGATVKVYTESSESVTITANQAGRWRFTVQDPGVGNHTVTAEVTNPATKVTSPPMELVAFKVVPSIGQNSGDKTSQPTDSSHWQPLFLAGTIAAGLFLLLAGIALPLLRHYSREAIR